MKEKSTAEVPLVRPSLNREAVPRGPKTFVARYAHLDFVCENVQKEGSCYVAPDRVRIDAGGAPPLLDYTFSILHPRCMGNSSFSKTEATSWPLRVKPRGAPLPKLAVVEVLYTAPSLRSAVHTTNAIRKEEGSCAGCP